MSAFANLLHAASGWLALTALLLVVLALISIVLVRRRLELFSPDLRRLIRHMEGKSGEEVVRDLLGNMEFLSERIARLEIATEDLNQRLQRAVQSVGLVRYNANTTIGGALSFSLALLDAHQTGVIITSLHTLEECRLYVRSVENGKCAHDLSEEEKEALEQALGQRPWVTERHTRHPQWRNRAP